MGIFGHLVRPLNLTLGFRALGTEFKLEVSTETTHVVWTESPSRFVGQTLQGSTAVIVRTLPAGMFLIVLILNSAEAQFGPMGQPVSGLGVPAANGGPFFPRPNSTPVGGSFGQTPPLQTSPAATPAVQETLDFELFEPGKLVAKVGDLPIFYGDVLGDLNQIVEQEMPDASNTLKDLRRKELFQQLLPRLIEQKTVYADFLRTMPDQSRLTEINKQLDQGFYDSEMSRLMEKLDVPTPKEFDEKLKSMGTSSRNVRQAWRESQIVGFYLGEKFKEEREVTHQEMLDYYRDHIEDYTKPARVKWEQLMVRFDRFPSKVEARNAIIAMGNRVVFGAPLEAIAKRESQGPMAANGGQYEWTDAGSIEDKQLEQQLFTLRIQYLSDIIESAEGFHIVRVQEREAQVTRPFVEIQSDIKAQILAEDRKAKVDEFLETLKTEIPVWTLFDDEAEAKSARDSLTIPIR